MKKRILSILLLCCMVLTLLPTAAFAEGEIPDSTNVTVTFDSAGGSPVAPQSVRFFIGFSPPVRVGSACPPRLFSDFLFF